MENAEEILHFLEDFSKRKPKVIPQELNDYLTYVARTGDPVYQWSLVKSLFKEKLLNVLTDFYETSPGIEIPPYPNVDPFNYDIMKNSLLERLDSFTSAPFTVQRICELLTCPRKQYNRVDKFMRAVEKNILVVSTREPGIQRHPEPENGEPAEPVINGSDNNSEYNVDVEMEDMSWKENSENRPNAEPQPSSSDTHISVDDIEARLQAKQDAPMDTQEKTTTQYESVTPPEPELNVAADESEIKTSEVTPEATTSGAVEDEKTETNANSSPEQQKVNEKMKTEEPSQDRLVIPEIKVDDADMTEQRLSVESNRAVEKSVSPITTEKESMVEEKPVEENQQTAIDESSSDSNTKEEIEPKIISEVSTSSEESSSSSDNTDGNSNSPKIDNEPHIDIQETSSDTNQFESNISNPEVENKPTDQAKESAVPNDTVADKPSVIQSENYSISDVKSELPQPPAEIPSTLEEPKKEVKESVTAEIDKKDEAPKSEATDISVENKES